MIFLFLKHLLLLHYDRRKHLLHLTLHCTRQRLLFAMRFQMLVEIIRLIKATIAQMTLEWTFAGVHAEAVKDSKLFK